MDLADGQTIELLVVVNRPAVVPIGAGPDGTRPAVAPCFRPWAGSRQGIVRSEPGPFDPPHLALDERAQQMFPKALRTGSGGKLFDL